MAFDLRHSCNGWVWACVSSVIQTNKCGERFSVWVCAPSSKGCALPITFPYHLPAALSPCFPFTLSGQIRLRLWSTGKLLFFLFLPPPSCQIRSLNWLIQAQQCPAMLKSSDNADSSAFPQAAAALWGDRLLRRLLKSRHQPGQGAGRLLWTEWGWCSRAGCRALYVLGGKLVFFALYCLTLTLGFFSQHCVDCCITLFSCTDAFSQEIHLAAQIPSSKEITYKDPKRSIGVQNHVFNNSQCKGVEALGLLECDGDRTAGQSNCKMIPGHKRVALGGTFSSLRILNLS